MNCHLCNSTAVRLFSQEQRGEQWFTLLYCPDCQVVQSWEQTGRVSPDYITLTAAAIDTEHLWCQAEHKQPAFQQWQHLTRPHWPTPPGRLLDVGCGTGGFLAYAARHDWEVFGFDASSAQAEHARHRFAQVRQADSCQEYLAQLPAPPPRFQMVTLWDVLEHIRTPHAFLRELAPLLTNDGLLFLSIPNAGALHWKRLLYRMMGKPLSLDPWEHVFYYSRHALQRWLPEWGWQVVAMGSVVCYPRPWSPFEMVRRGGFALLNRMPDWAPQIYCMARPLPPRSP
ncbi:MAG: class I SAM-dependent methyltransferase [Magnetococcales bacterium]|nr:class I SAM-dependent methyltransferase [Magnetococcales bacterium]